MSRAPPSEADSTQASQSSSIGGCDLSGSESVDKIALGKKTSAPGGIIGNLLNACEFALRRTGNEFEIHAKGALAIIGVIAVVFLIVHFGAAH